MKLISLWAKQHLWAARLLLIIAQTVLVSTAFFVGAIFSNLSFISSDTIKSLGLFLFFVGLILYPIKQARFAFLRHCYRRQKRIDGILVFSSLLLFFSMGQQFIAEPVSVSTDVTQNNAWHAELVVHSRTTNVSPKSSKNAIRKQNRMKRKELRKKLKQTINNQKKELSWGEEALLVVLTLLLGCALVYGVLILSCSLACSGMEALAYIVAGVGVPLVITLAVLTIRRIFGKTKKMQEL